jgi:hypothetical protein
LLSRIYSVNINENAILLPFVYDGLLDDSLSDDSLLTVFWITIF